MPPEPAPGPHPLPPPDLAGRELPIVTGAGPWFRLHRASRGPLHFGRSATFGFDDPAGQYGVLYVGEDPSCAFIETFGRGPNVAGVVTVAALAERHLAHFVLTACDAKPGAPVKAKLPVSTKLESILVLMGWCISDATGVALLACRYCLRLIPCMAIRRHVIAVEEREYEAKPDPRSGIAGG